MCTTNDPNLAQRLMLIRNHGENVTTELGIDDITNLIGFNFRMTNMQAALGVAQMERINELLEHKEKIFKNYDQKFNKTKNISLLPSNNWSKNSFWLYTLVINGIGEKKRDKLLQSLKNRGVECRPVFYPLNTMKPYEKFSKGDYKISENLSMNSLSLPSSSGLTANEQNYISKVFLEELSNIK